MQLLQSVYDRAFAAHHHHLEYGFLGAVVAVLGAAFALGYPYVVVLLGDDEVHVLAQPLARHQHLAHGEGTLYDKRFVDAHQVLDPGQLEQIVADGDFTCRVEARVYQQLVEQCRIEHYVAVVADEGVAAVGVERCDVDVASLAEPRQQLYKKTVAEGLLEIEVVLAGVHLGSQRLFGHVGVEIGQHAAELLVLEQAVKDVR